MLTAHVTVFSLCSCTAEDIQMQVGATSPLLITIGSAIVLYCIMRCVRKWCYNTIGELLFWCVMRMRTCAQGEILT